MPLCGALSPLLMCVHSKGELGLGLQGEDSPNDNYLFRVTANPVMSAHRANVTSIQGTLPPPEQQRRDDQERVQAHGTPVDERRQDVRFDVGDDEAQGPYDLVRGPVRRGAPRAASRRLALSLPVRGRRAATVRLSGMSARGIGDVREGCVDVGRRTGVLLRLARESGHTGRLYGFDPAKRRYSRPSIMLAMLPRRPSITAIISIASPLT